MVLTAYFDESGVHPGSDAVSVAGYLSTQSRWEAFEIAWQKVLADYDLKYFHMTDFSASQQQFRGWDRDEDRRQNCFARLLDIINQYAIGSVGVVIPTKGYSEIISSRADKFVGGKYGLASSMCALSLAKILNITRVVGNIHYVFEAGGIGWGQLQKVFQEHLKTAGGRQAMRLSGIQVAPKDGFAALQAADILAYELHKGLPRQLGLDSQPQRSYPQSRLRMIPSNWTWLDSSGLKDIGQVLEARIKLDELGEDWWRPQSYERDFNPPITISISDFQTRWAWTSQFMGKGTPLGVKTA